jgi:hypothetical protein
MNSRNIMCDCGHPARLHQSGSCAGYVEVDKYKYLDKLHLGGRKYSPFCGCQRSHWAVIDDYLENLATELKPPS